MAVKAPAELTGDGDLAWMSPAVRAGELVDETMSWLRYRGISGPDYRPYSSPPEGLHCFAVDVGSRGTDIAKHAIIELERDAALAAADAPLGYRLGESPDHPCAGP
jgi:hypothetical protein